MTLSHEFLVFDYEATGLRPYREGHRITTCSITAPDLTTIAFDFSKFGKFGHLFKKMLRSSHVGKGAHNLQFEQLWSEVMVGVTPHPWKWDSMIAAHMIDNRGKIASLKFQTYANFGVIDYDSHLKKYLEAPAQEQNRHGCNAFNRMEELVSTPKGKAALLKYNGLDTIYEMKLALKQMEILGCA
jgi:hypothetical protein